MKSAAEMMDLKENCMTSCSRSYYIERVYAELQLQTPDIL